METLDPKVAQELERQALEKFSQKVPKTAKSSPSAQKDFIHSKVLGKFKSAFPFELFPDELIISERRVIWIHKYGLWMNRVVSVLHQDIADIEASSGPIVGHLHIRNFTGGEEIIMEHLWRKDLQKARDLVESMMLAKRVGVKGGVPKDSTQEKLEKMMHVDF